MNSTPSRDCSMASRIPVSRFRLEQAAIGELSYAVPRAGAFYDKCAVRRGISIFEVHQRKGIVSLIVERCRTPHSHNGMRASASVVPNAVME